MTTRIDRLVTGLLVVLAGLLAAWRLWGDRWGWLGLLNSWAEWSRWATLLLAGWLVARGHPARALLVLPLVGSSPVPARLPTASHPNGGESFTLFSANLYTHNPHIERHIELALEIGPEIICVQEFKLTFMAAFNAGLSGDYPYRILHPHVDAYGFGIFSRLPIEAGGHWSEPGVRPFAQRVYLQAPGGTVALYNVHLCPPTANSTLKRGLTWGFRTREAQIAFLQAQIEQDGLPAIIVGDHNFSEAADAYRMARATWRDAWQQAGVGARWTWPTRAFPHPVFRVTPPLLRLDFCFLSGGVQARQLRHLSAQSGSDHRVLLATLAVGA